MKRKDKQQGRFLVQPYSDIIIPLEVNAAHTNSLTRISIPKNEKASIRNELEHQGITKESLYVGKDPTIEDLILRLRKKFGV